MPTSLGSLIADELNIRWKEPLLTEALNHKMQTVVPRGIYKGFRLGTSGNPLTVSVTSDSSGLHIAQYEPANGYTLQVRRSGGTFLLDLSALASTTVVVAIYAKYAVNQTTVGEIRAYTAAEWAAVPSFQDELIVLGTVVVPAAGTIAAASITETLRVMAWANEAPDAARWEQVLQNGGFQDGPRSGDIARTDSFANWELYNLGAGAVLGTQLGAFVNTTQGRAPYTTSLEINAVTGGGDHRFLALQWLSTTSVAASRVRIRLYYRVNQVPTAGVVSVSCSWAGALGSVAGGSVLYDLDLGSTNAAIDRVLDVVAVAPAGAERLISFQIQGASSLSFPAPGAALRFSDVSVWVDSPLPSLTRAVEERYGQNAVLRKAVFTAQNFNHSGRGQFPKLEVDASSFNLQVRRRDEDTTPDSPGQDFMVPDGALVAQAFEYVPTRTSTRVFGIGYFRPDTAAEWVLTLAGAGAGVATPITNNANGHFCLDGLPAGAVVTRIDVLVSTSTNRGTSADRWQASIYEVTLDFTAPSYAAVQISTTINDLGGATGPDVMSWISPTISITILEETDLVIEIQGPNGSLGVGDHLYGVRVLFEDPGPQNY